MITKIRYISIPFLSIGLLGVFLTSDSLYEQRRLEGWTLFDLADAPGTGSWGNLADAEIQVDSAGRVWLHDTGQCNDLCVYEGLSWTYITLPARGTPTRFLREGSDGVMWFRVGDEVVTVKDAHPQVFFQPSDLRVTNLEWIYAFAVDASGRLWIGWQWRSRTAHGPGVSIFDGSELLTYTSVNSSLPSRGSIQSISLDDNGRAWVATSEGLTIFDGGSSVTYLPDNSGILSEGIQSARFNSLGDAWIQSSGGLNLLRGHTWVSFPDINVNDMAFDRAGDPWVVTGDGGLLHYEGQTWTTLVGGFRWFGLSGELALDDDARVWADTAEGLAVFDGQTITLVAPYNSGLPEGGFIDDIAVDHEGRVWVGNARSISIFDPSAGTLYTPPTVLVIARGYLRSGRWLFPAFTILLWIAINLNSRMGYRWAIGLGAAMTLLLVLPIGIAVMLGGAAGAFIHSSNTTAGAIVGSTATLALILLTFLLIGSLGGFG